MQQPAPNTQQKIQAALARAKEQRDRPRFPVSVIALGLAALIAVCLLIAASVFDEIANRPANAAVDRHIRAFSQIREGMPEAEVVRIMGREPVTEGGRRTLNFFAVRPETFFSRLLMHPTTSHHGYVVEFEDGTVKRIGHSTLYD